MKRTGFRNLRPGNLRLHILPILAWLAAVAAVVGMFTGRTQRFEVMGIVQTNSRVIAASCNAKVRDVPVQLFEKVSSGQTLAVLDAVLDPVDTNRRQVQLAAASAEIHRLMAQLIPTQEQFLAEASERENDELVARRRFTIDVEQARLRILELKALIETDKILLEDLATEVKIASELLQTQAIAPYELQKAQVQYDAIAKKIDENTQLLAQAEIDLSEARSRYDLYAKTSPFHPSVESALEVIRKEIKGQEQLIDTLLIEPPAMVLTSPFNGIVSQIQRMPGETVRPGEVILVVAQAKPTDIIVYASQAQAGRIKEGMAVELISNNEPMQIARSQVVRVSPEIASIPERLWLSPDVNEYGRPLLIKIPPGMKLIPGQIVGVRGL